MKMILMAFLCAGLVLLQFPAVAQTPSPSENSTTQQPAPSTSASEARTFMGKIVKDGDRLVLAGGDGKTTYQLDDQQKAGTFVNKQVKVTGVLDGSTGVIRVDAIEPAA